jgi:hypothetical protein
MASNRRAVTEGDFIDFNGQMIDLNNLTEQQYNEVMAYALAMEQQHRNVGGQAN